MKVSQAFYRRTQLWREQISEIDPRISVTPSAVDKSLFVCVLNMRGIAREEHMRVNTNDCDLEASVNDRRDYRCFPRCNFRPKKLDMIESCLIIALFAGNDYFAKTMKL